MEFQNNAAAWNAYSEAFAFIGNSLLKSMRYTGTAGLDPDFWAQFPDFDSDDVARACESLESFASSLQGGAASEEETVSSVSAEFSRLFMGPPHPAASPWESVYTTGNTKVGYGKATFEMREELRQAGLELSNENRQYEDHMGIELLLLSVLCARAGEAVAEVGGSDAAARAVAFAESHPASWIDTFEQAIAEAAPQGYYHLLVSLAHALLAQFVK